MRTNPEEFRAFHELLTKGRPNYAPHYFKLKTNDKDPDVRGSWKESKLTFEQAYELMKIGSNIGVAGTDADGLVIIDLDKSGIEDVKPTLRIKSRKRQGWHNFYFTEDPKCKTNIPTEDHGEVRSSWQYVVACGSFVPLEQEKIDKLPPPERELAGCYTIENRVPPVDISFDELPAIFKMQVYEQEKPAIEPTKKKVNFRSGFWKLSCHDIFKDAPPPHVRWASPFHESETGKNTSMSTQGLIHCWRHNVSLTAIQVLAVMSGAMSCLDAGEGHGGSGAGPSKLDLKNKELVRKIWSFAKENSYLPIDDPDPYEVGRKVSDTKDAEEKETQAQTLLRLAEGAEFIITSTDDTFALIERKGHREILPLRSKAFRKWLSLLFYDEIDKPPGSQALEDALKMLEALAEPNAIRAEVHVRLAHHGGAIYFDLGSADWKVVEIDQDGWRIVSDPPVFFWRPKGQRAIPEPVADGSLDELRPLVNLPDEAEWILTVAWTVGAFHPEGPYAILCPIAEAGCAKSFLLKLLKNIIDPTRVELRTVPREERDLMIAAHHNWMIAFDNLSGIPPWLSDAICRLATGGGFGTRQLYHDQEEIQFWSKRPVALNGIGDFVTRGDMADRCIFLHPPAITKEKRKEEAELLRDFRKIQPRVLGALLDAVSMALARRNEIILPALPRMADFAKWIVAAEPALPWPEGAFLAAYIRERESATETLLEADTVASAIRQLMEGRLDWTGTATELLDTLGGYVTERVSKGKQWPDTSQKLGLRLSYASPSLRAVGIEVDRKHSGGRIISIRKGTQKAVQAVLAVQEESENEALARQESGWTTEKDEAVQAVQELSNKGSQAVQAVQELSNKGEDEPDTITEDGLDGLDNLDDKIHTLSKKHLEQADPDDECTIELIRREHESGVLLEDLVRRWPTDLLIKAGIPGVRGRV